MSTPLALRLDSPSIVRNRAVLLTVAVAIVVSGSVTAWLLSSNEPKTDTLQNVPAATVPAIPLASANAAAVVTAPHTSDGAVTASASFLSFYGDALGSSDLTVLSSFSELIDQTASPTLADDIGKAQSSIQQGFASSASHDVRLSPMAYKVLSYADTKESTVSIWSVLMVASDSSVQSTWTTSDVSLAWESGHYRITKWVVRPGPAPQNSSSDPGADANNAASLIGVLDGFEPYRQAPADSNNAPSSQGSK